MIIRPAQPEDVTAVTQIDHACFRDGWSADYYRDEIANPIARLIVTEEYGEVSGFLLFWCLPPQADILRMAVPMERRNEGIGVQLVENMLKTAQSEGTREVFLEVRRSNEVARRLYRKAGFVQTGIRSDYYRNPQEDAVCMVWRQRR
ncbi:MAG TPA: ribosomal-protein-alanine N-acetyltransferase [Candidatus Aminicenantes bacterium]|nr:ribosomal-protein-alanine N-acetyltransferase [Candidatus Aminicenantes bacterium]